METQNNTPPKLTQAELAPYIISMAISSAAELIILTILLATACIAHGIWRGLAIFLGVFLFMVFQRIENKTLKHIERLGYIRENGVFMPI